MRQAGDAISLFQHSRLEHLPGPTLTEQNKADLTRCAEDILLAREAHFPATIADLYDPKTMPADLREAHERNDEVLERIYIGRRFRNDTERLEKLFELYTKMTAAQSGSRERKARGERMTDETKIRSLRLRHYARTGARPRRTSSACARCRSAPSAARRAIPADQVAAGLGQVPGADVHRARQAAQPGLKQAIIVVPERSIGGSFADEPLTQYGFLADWTVKPQWNLCNAPAPDNGGKVKAVGEFLASDDKVLVCTHATFRFAVDEFGVEAFDDRLIAVDEFHHVSANPDNRLGAQLGRASSRATRSTSWR